MSGVWHPTGRAKVNANSPAALGVCDRCGLTYNLKADLRWQYQWQGTQLQNLRLLVCDECLDVPQPQLKVIILPPDPLPVLNPRPEQYAAEVPSYMTTRSGRVMATISGIPLTRTIRVTPQPDPNDPYSFVPL